MNSKTTSQRHPLLQRPQTVTRTSLAALVIAAMCLPGCRFSTPSIDEQQALAQKGAFVTGTPAWSNLATRGKADAGIIPNSYGQWSVSDSTDRTQSSAENVRARIREEQQSSVSTTGAERINTQVSDNSSPLARIAAKCPSAETAASDALTTVSRDERITKYRRLVRSCPDSSDLWLWLGKDYKAAGRLAEARQALEQASFIDPSNTEAKALLGELGSANN